MRQGVPKFEKIFKIYSFLSDFGPFWGVQNVRKFMGNPPTNRVNVCNVKDKHVNFQTNLIFLFRLKNLSWLIAGAVINSF